MRPLGSGVPTGPPDLASLISELTQRALTSGSKAEFRGRALALLARSLQLDRATWDAVPPFGDLRVAFPGPDGTGSEVGRRADVEAEGAGRRETARRGASSSRGFLRLELERFGRIHAILTVERGGGVFGAREVDWLRTLLPTLIVADEGAAGSARPLTPREADIVDYVRLGYTNAEIALATGCSVPAIRNLLVRVFDKMGVRTRAQLVGGPLSTTGLTRREREIVERLRSGMTNREIGLALGISTNTVRNTLARLFGKMGVCTRSELMGALVSQDLRSV